MSITIENNLKPGIDSNSERIHYLPCQVEGDGEANVKKYFDPYIKQHKDGTYTASFRGHPLVGSTLSGYHLTAISEAKKPLGSEANRRFHVMRKAEDFTVWGWDQQPSKNNPLNMAAQWFRIAEALHAPTQKCD